MAAVLLAAGSSTRFGALKQLAPIEGVPMLAHAVRELLATTVDTLVVVLGHEGKAVRKGLEPYVDDTRIRFVNNPRAAEGMSGSIATGVRAVADSDGVLIALGDMPEIRAATISLLLDVFRATPFGIVAPTLSGTRGHPVLFDRRYFDALQHLKGDRGATPVLRLHAADLLTVAVDDPGVLRDVDLPIACRGTPARRRSTP